MIKNNDSILYPTNLPHGYWIWPTDSTESYADGPLELSQVLNGERDITEKHFCKFVHTILNETDGSPSDDSEYLRKISVVPSYANYGKLSSFIIEIEGSPPKFTLFVRLLPENNIILFNGRIIAKNTKKHKLLSALIEQFIKSEEA